MRKLILIILMCYSPLLCGEWTHISTITEGELSKYELSGAFIKAIDKDKIMVSGNIGLIYPYIFKSNDRAKTWNISLEDIPIEDENGKVIYHPKRMFDFEYIDSLHAIMMCDGLRYWRTEDGGENWVYDSLLSNKEGGNGTVSNRNKAVASYGGLIFSSLNYGKSWDNYYSKFDFNFDLNNGGVIPYELSFLSDSVLIADGTYFVDFYHEDNVYFVAKSTDLGRNWEVTYIKDYKYSSRYIEVNSRIIAAGSQQTKPYAGSYRDLIRISEDGGYTWRTVLDTLSFPSSILWDVEFINDNDGITYSRDFDKLYRTTDGGETWHRDFGMQDFQYPPYDYEYLPNGEILAVARTGKVYKWSDPKLSVEEDARPIEQKKEISIYPNPVAQTQEINIKFNPTIYGPASVSIIDISGREVSTFETNLQSREEHLRFAPTNDLPAGSYFVQIEYINGIAERQGFVVE